MTNLKIHHIIENFDPIAIRIFNEGNSFHFTYNYEEFNRLLTFQQLQQKVSVPSVGFFMNSTPRLANLSQAASTSGTIIPM